LYVPQFFNGPGVSGMGDSLIQANPLMQAGVYPFTSSGDTKDALQ
jgi:hypothetical protein